MDIRIFKSLKCFVVAILFILIAFQSVFATKSLSSEEKLIFVLAKNIGELTYYYTDIASNNKIMGLAMLNGKFKHLDSLMARQNLLDNEINLSKSTIKSFSSAKSELENSYVKGDYNFKKFISSQQNYVRYSQDLRNDIEYLYGPKYTWLFDAGFLVSFTEHSMKSEYKQKLVLLQYGYVLDFIPYDLPTSVIASLSKVATAKDGELTSNQVDIMREASQNVITYFMNPEAYAPPVTLKMLVGKWEGRLAPPGADYHKAALVIRPDMTAILDVEGLFDAMPVNDVTLTQSLISFNIEPFGEEKLIIKFTGRIVDDVISGEAVDISGQKGLWQFLKTPEISVDSDVFSPLDSNNRLFAFDNLIGSWKGKILEESGAISNAELNVNLQDDTVLSVENDRVQDNYSVKNLAVNENAIKFNVTPKDQDVELTFIGEIKGRVIEGNIQATDGTRGYWKIVKVSGSKPLKELNNAYLNPYKLCDINLDLPYLPEFTLVANKKVIVSSGKVFKGKYKGIMTFPDSTEASIILILKDKNSKMILTSAEDKAEIELDVSELSITDREISFITTIEGQKGTKVSFKGKVFGNYIYGKAINTNGSELKWEVAADKVAQELISKVKKSDTTKILGSWAGEIKFSEIITLPALLEVTNTLKTLMLGEHKPLELSDIVLDGDSVSFIASDENNTLTFSGVLQENMMQGVLTTPEGRSITMKIELTKPCFTEILSGIWKGNISTGSAKADIVFDFSCDKGKKVYIDDPKAETGRLELVVKDFKSGPENITFVAVVPNSISTVEFSGALTLEGITGKAKSHIQNGQTLTWNVSRSNLVEYLPETESTDVQKEEMALQEGTFSFLDVIKDQPETLKEDKIPEKSLKEKEKIRNNPGKDAKIEDKKEEKTAKPIKKERKKKSKKEKKQKKKHKKRLKNPKTPDEAMFKESEVKKVKKEMKKLQEQQQKPEEEEKRDKKLQEKPFPVDTEEKTHLETDPVEASPYEKMLGLPEKAAVQDLQNKPPTSQQMKDSEELKPEELYGKWVGVMSTPQGDEGEILLEIKDGESYLYIDDKGKKKPFKLFDYKQEGKNIFFSVKPSADDSFEIRFKGALIQGVLSGEATDPQGQKGKWHAHKP